MKRACNILTRMIMNMGQLCEFHMVIKKQIIYMKKSYTILFTIFFTFIFGLESFGQSALSGIRVRDLELTPDENNVDVNFTMDVGKKAVQSDYERTISFWLINGQNRVQLPSVAIVGRRSQIMAERRTGSYDEFPEVSAMPKIVTTKGQSIDYSTKVVFQPWMEGAKLVAESVRRGCCKVLADGSSVVADNITFYIQPAPVPDKLSTGDRLAQQYPFLAPVSEMANFDFNNRDGSVTLYFRQAISTLDLDFRDNRSRFETLMRVIDELERSNDSKVARIMVAGFASPEGTVEFNQALSQRRADVIVNQLRYRSGIRQDLIQVFYGGEDWNGLRKMVERSDLPEKYSIINIIDNTPLWDSYRKIGRESQLMKLNGGRTYRYLYHNYFPDLRNATYIRVFYE